MGSLWFGNLEHYVLCVPCIMVNPLNAELNPICPLLILFGAHYTGCCPRRNVPDFGKVFLMLKYTDITQNTYVQS